MQAIDEQKVMAYLQRRELCISISASCCSTVVHSNVEKSPYKHVNLVGGSSLNLYVDALYNDDLPSVNGDFSDVRSSNESGLLVEHSEHDHATELEGGQTFPHLPIHN